MDEIIVLMKKVIDPVFGEHSDQWVNVGFTDDHRKAGIWRSGEHRDERRKTERLNRVT